jgi:hypothetical protein
MGCDYGDDGDEVVLWHCDSLEGKFAMRADDSGGRAGLREFAMHGAGDSVHFSGILFS